MKLTLKNTTLTALSALAVLSASACMSEPRTLPPGEYKSETSSKNSAGTTTKKKTETEVYYDANGNKRAVQETETTRDPKGLFNKETTKSTKTYQ